MVAPSARTRQLPPGASRVEAVNERGAKLAGIGWANFSRYGNVTPPEAGQEVEATLREGKTGGEWIQELRVLDANGTPAGPAIGPATVSARRPRWAADPSPRPLGGAPSRWSRRPPASDP
jgi:hypothetical protein